MTHRFEKNTSSVRYFTKGLFSATWATVKFPHEDVNKQRWNIQRGCQPVLCTGFDRMFPSVTALFVGWFFVVVILGGFVCSFVFWAEGGKGEVGRIDENSIKEPFTYLESEFFTKVGEQILIPISCLAVQPHNMVGTSRDPASNQFQYPTQTLCLGRSFKRRLMLFKNITLSVLSIHSYYCQWGWLWSDSYPPNFLLETTPRFSPFLQGDLLD